jgi:prophage regulatory protein
MTDELNSLRIIRERECRRLTGLSRQRRWVLRNEGRFPSPIRISDKLVGWYEKDIMEWLYSRSQVDLQSA